MDLPLPTYGDDQQSIFTRHKNNLEFTMDYDSGYVSHNPESNLDSSLESLAEKTARFVPDKPIYLSEDALLEVPELSNFHNLSMQIDREDYEETRLLFNLPYTESEIILPNTTETYKMNYSGFTETSDESDVEIPLVNKIIIDKLDIMQLPDQMITNESNLEETNCSETSEEYFRGFPTETCASTVFPSVTNTLASDDSKKKLTLIFSKSSSENVYSVKRKYQSLSPDKTTSPSKNFVEASHQFDESVENCDKSGADFVDHPSAPASENNLLSEYLKNFSETCLVNEQTHIKDGGKVIEVYSSELSKRDKGSDGGESVEQETVQMCEVPRVINATESKTPKKKFKNMMDPNLSPDLFDDEDVVQTIRVSQPPCHVAEEQFIIKKDRAVLRRAQNNLKGVIPPYCMTVFNMSVNEMLNKIEENDAYFWHRSGAVSEQNSSLNNSVTSQDAVSKSLLLTCSIEEAREKEFPVVLGERCHGLHYNSSKVSEEFEDLCTKYCQRYVGAETQSSCTVFEANCSSPIKRKQIKQRWPAKSPGRRLSHLAKRRITFSSANLQNNPSFAGSRARQILVDAKKLQLLKRKKSPRKTPVKSPRVKPRTPSSSAKKKLAMRFRKVTGEIEKSVSLSTELSSKRALFQSPDRDSNSSLFLPGTSGTSTYAAGDFHNQKPSTKRVLFLSPSKKPPRASPFKRSPFRRLDLGEVRKRKRSSESEDAQPSKMPRSLSMDVRSSASDVRTANRTRSEMSISSYTGELSAAHKKKLQWAVYEALRSQSIPPAHPQFKLYASILARVTRRFLPDGAAAKLEGGTSDRMLRIARHHVFAVLKGKSVDEIYAEHVKSKARTVKPQGYVSVDEYDVVRRQPLRDSSTLNKSHENENKIDRIRKVINF